MYQNSALAGIKRHAKTLDFDDFTYTWCINERCRISAFLPQLMGIMWHNGQFGGKKWDNKGQLSHLIEAI
jgi:hypothetical protein